MGAGHGKPQALCWSSAVHAVQPRNLARHEASTPRMTLIKTAHTNDSDVAAATKASLNPRGSYVNLTCAAPAGKSMVWKTPSEMTIGAGWPLTVADHPCINSSRRINLLDLVHDALTRSWDNGTNVQDGAEK